MTTPTMMPAAAQVVAAPSTPIEPSAIAAVSFFDEGTALLSGLRQADDGKTRRSSAAPAAGSRN